MSTSIPRSITLYDRLCDYFLNWYLPTVLVIGIAGSAFCLWFIIYSRMFQTNLKLWLLSICVGDLMILLLDGGRMAVKVLWRNYDVQDQSTLLCHLHLFFSNYFLYWSAYMQAGMSLHRCFHVLRPFQARRHLTMGRLWSIWSSITVLLIFPLLPYPLYWKLQKGDCDPIHKGIYYITTALDTIVLGLIPLTVMCCSSVAIICRVVWKDSQFTPVLQTRTSCKESMRASEGSTLLRPSSSIRRSFLTIPLRFSNRKISTTMFTTNLGASNSTEPIKEVNPAAAMDTVNEVQECDFEIPEPLVTSTRMIHTLSHTLSQGSSHSAPASDSLKRKRLNQNTLSFRNNIRFQSFLVRANPSIGEGSFHSRDDRIRGSRHGNWIRSNTRHVTRLLLGMNLWYFLTTFPMISYFFCLNYVLGNQVGITISHETHRFCYYLLRAICYMNCSFNWIFYCFSGKSFRQNVRQVFCGRLSVVSIRRGASYRPY